jgi:hypothetical protein
LNHSPFAHLFICGVQGEGMTIRRKKTTSSREGLGISHERTVQDCEGTWIGREQAAFGCQRMEENDGGLGVNVVCLDEKRRATEELLRPTTGRDLSP